MIVELRHGGGAAAASPDGDVGDGQLLVVLEHLVGHLHPRHHLGAGEGGHCPAFISRVGADNFRYCF